MPINGVSFGISPVTEVANIAKRDVLEPAPITPGTDRVSQVSPVIVSVSFAILLTLRVSSLTRRENYLKNLDVDAARSPTRTE
jgi:hypothetical protein